jgi:hypothetical protein
MQRTATEIVDVIQANRFASLTDASGIEYFNRVYGNLIANFPTFFKTINSAPIAVAFSAGDQELAVTTPFLNQVEYALWVPASGNTIRIPVVTVESLNRGSAGGGVLWRDAASATPTACYFIADANGLRVGFNSKVPAGTLKLYGSPLPATLTGSSKTPPLPTDGAFIEGISYYYMLDRRHPSAQTFFQTYQMEMAILKSWLMTFSEEFQNEERNVRES